MHYCTQCFTTELILTHHYCKENCRSYNHTLRSPPQPSSLLPHISSSDLTSSSYHIAVAKTVNPSEMWNVGNDISYSRPSSNTETLQLELEVIYLHGHCMAYPPAV